MGRHAQGRCREPHARLAVHQGARSSTGHTRAQARAIVAVEPDVIVNGQRFTQFHDKLAKLVPDATVLALDPREDKPFADELKRQTTVLGEVFDKKAEATKLTDDFDAAIARAKEAYNGQDTVMAVIASGGKLGYVAPRTGRSSAVFDCSAEAPLEVDDSRPTTGDDIGRGDASQPTGSRPGRDAAWRADRGGYKARQRGSRRAAAMKSVTQSRAERVTACDTYTNEGSRPTQEFLNDSHALEGRADNARVERP